jgi:hypothetical protein
MSLPTPDPSQRGIGLVRSKFGSPPLEGLGVGSWSQRVDAESWELSMNLSAETKQ